MDKKSWTSRSIGAAWQHRFFYGLIRLCGRRAAYAMLAVVIFYYMLFRPDQRRKSEFYLRRRFPGARGLRLWLHSYRMSLALGKSLIDRAVVGILGSSSTRVDLEGKEELLALLAEGKGLILITAHVGSWQTAMAALDFLNQPVSLLLQREAGDIDRHYFEHGGRDCPFRIIDPSGYLGGALEMIEVLKNGEILSVMSDRMLGSDRNAVAVDFLGDPVPFPFSAYKLASATGAPVGVLLSAKTGVDSYELRLARVIRVPSGLRRGSEAFVPYVRQFAETLEEYTQRYPYQFFNFYDMWDSEFAESAPDPQDHKE
ncbi:MAG: lysophospholipid acyltransferase family protein [Syntrophotaleaceae bacterium]